MTKEEQVQKLFDSSILMLSMLGTNVERGMGIHMLWEIAQEIKIVDSVRYCDDLIGRIGVFKMRALDPKIEPFTSASGSMPPPSNAEFYGNPLEVIASVLAHLYISNDPKFTAIVTFVILDFAANIGIFPREKISRVPFELGKVYFPSYVAAKKDLMDYFLGVESPRLQ